MQGEDFEDEGNDDAQRCPEDEDLIEGKAENPGDLQDLHDVVGDGGREGGDTRPEANTVERRHRGIRFLGRQVDVHSPETSSERSLEVPSSTVVSLPPGLY